MSQAFGSFSWLYLMAFVVHDLEYISLMTSGAYSNLLLIISPKEEAVTRPRRCKSHSPD